MFMGAGWRISSHPAPTPSANSTNMCDGFYGFIPALGYWTIARDRGGSLHTAEHARVARAIAAAGMVLLKNENDLLPLSRPGPIVLSGPGVDRVMYGAGSAEVNQGQGNISLLKGMREQFGDSRIEVVTPEATIPGDAALFVYAATAVPGQEGTDAEDIAIPSEQIAQIKSLANKTDRLLVLVQTATATDLSPIVREADAMIVAWFGGQEFGRAAADIISGKTAPQGRLPVTLARSLGDYPAAVLKTWPGRLIFAEHPGGGSAPVPFDPQHRFPVIAYKAHYLEGMLIGYRWFDKQNIAVNYPFGFGLTYTTFSLSGL